LTSEVGKLRKDLKRSFFASRLAAADMDSKKAWKVIHEFIEKPRKSESSCRTFSHNGTSVTGDVEIAEAFCDFFTDIGPNLAEKVRVTPGKSHKDYLGESSIGSVFMWPTTPAEIASCCRDLDHSKGPGYDDFSPAIVKLMADEISVPLSGLVNACLEEGHFPDFLKVARITPVFKADDPTLFSNYRPISVLSVFSKIFERVIQNRLLGFFEARGHLLGGQYGFRCGHSTDMAIIDMVEKIRKAWDMGEHCMGIFVDLSKAFDTVDHCILLSKLEHAGVRGIPLELIRSYFRNRRQYVAFNGGESSLREITCGVPQGSILGPLFFLLYVNDLVRSSEFFRFVLFADDTNLFATAKTRGALYKKVREELTGLHVIS
jgi:hypothetical protein